MSNPIEAPDRIDYAGRCHVRFGKKWLLLHIDPNRLFTIDRDGFAGFAPVAAGFQMKAQGAEQFLGLLFAAALATTCYGYSQRHQQIDIESLPTHRHSTLNNRNALGM